MLAYVIRRLLHRTGVLFAASVLVLFNRLADLAYGWLDPRVRLA